MYQDNQRRVTADLGVADRCAEAVSSQMPPGAHRLSIPLSKKLEDS